MANGSNISELAKYFSDEDAARALLEEMRWGKDGAVCPRCGGDKPYKLTPKATSTKPGRKGLYKCRACRKQFTVTVGTVFEDSHIPISKWLLAIHLLASSKKGMSAHQLHRNLGISYKGAWFMAHRLRYAMAQGPLADLMKGMVEIDETYVGAKRKRGTSRGVPTPESHKTPVVALVERGTGRVRAFPMMYITARNLGKAIESNVAHNATMMTDELSAYKSVAADADRKHITVTHSMVWVMLNPSTADATEDDPTIRKCIGFAKAHHHGGIIVVNLFAWRATDPKELPPLPDYTRVGPENDVHIQWAINAPLLVTVVGGWGAARFARHRATTVRVNIQARRPVHCFGKSKDGAPNHPLYLPYTTPMERL